MKMTLEHIFDRQVKLLRRTTWKCGHIQREVIAFILKARETGRAVKVRDLYHMLATKLGRRKMRDKLSQALEGLQKRLIIKIC